MMRAELADHANGDWITRKGMLRSPFNSLVSPGSPERADEEREVIGTNLINLLSELPIRCIPAAAPWMGTQRQVIVCHVERLENQQPARDALQKRQGQPAPDMRNITAAEVTFVNAHFVEAVGGNQRKGCFSKRAVRVQDRDPVTGREISGNHVL
jgi:hypothetical protein